MRGLVVAILCLSAAGGGCARQANDRDEPAPVLTAAPSDKPKVPADDRPILLKPARVFDGLKTHAGWVVLVKGWCLVSNSALVITSVFPVGGTAGDTVCTRRNRRKTERMQAFYRAANSGD